MVSDETLIQVEGLSKKFCRNLKRSLWYGVQDILKEWRRVDTRSAGLREGEFWANQNINFEVKRGECIGLIGSNGAGKTTLLRQINGLIKPDAGQILLKGRIGAIISLGAGFSPVLTGRENILINGAILGMGHKEMQRRFDEIVEFAEIAHAIDAPVRTYSSGMQVRLGFAVAAMLDPDILLLDEVLAVGDGAFRNKCYRRIGELKRRCAVVLVSHNMEHIQTACDRVVVLQKGQVIFDGEPERAIEIYNEISQETSPTQVTPLQVLPPLTHARITRAPIHLEPSEPLSFELELQSEETLSDALELVATICDNGGRHVAQWRSTRAEHPIALQAGSNRISVQTSPLQLKGGQYHVELNLRRRGDIAPITQSSNAFSFQIRGPHISGPPYQLS